MKLKMFTEYHPDTLELNCNVWLEKQSAIRIHQTNLTVTPNGMIVLILFYS